MDRQARSTQARGAPGADARSSAVRADSVPEEQAASLRRASGPWRGLGALAFAAALGACAPESARPVPPGRGPILVGEFHALTGADSARGRALHAGFSLAIEEANARGGIHGRAIEVRTFDDRGRADETQVAMRRPLDEDRAVLVVGGTTPALADVAAREADGAPYVSPFGVGLEPAGSARRFGCRADAAWSDKDLDPAFLASWNARRSLEPAGADAALGYDVGLVVRAALEDASTYDPKDLWAALAEPRALRGARGVNLGESGARAARAMGTEPASR